MIATDLMDYDYTTHRYILKTDTVKNMLGIDLKLLNQSGNNTDDKIFLRRISDSVYSYQYKQMLPKDRKVLEFRIFDEEDARNGIMYAMLEQIVYSRVGGNHLLRDLAGINVNTGTVIDLQDIEMATVSIAVKEALRTYNLDPIRYSYRISDNVYRVGY